MTGKNAFLMFTVLVFCLIMALFFFGADTDISKFLFAMILGMASCAILARSPVSTSPDTTRSHADFTSAGMARSSSKMPGLRAEYIGLGLLVVFVLVDWQLGRLGPALGHYLVLTSAAGLYLATRELVLYAKSITKLWAILAAGISLYALWAFVDFMSAPEYLFGQPRPYHENRLSGAFLSANIAAAVFGIGLVIALSLVMRHAVTRRGQSLASLLINIFRHGWLGVVGVVFCTTALLLTASRAGIAIFLLMATLYLIWEIFAYRRPGRAETGLSLTTLGPISGIGLIVSLILVTSGGEVGLRYAELEAGTNGRGEMFSAYWHMALEAPLLGHGPGSFAQINQQAMTAQNAHILVTQGAAHNVILQWLLQSGVLGSIAMIAVTMFLLADVAANITRGGSHRGFSRAILCASAGLILHSMVDFPLELPSVTWLWALLLGIGAGLSKRACRMQSRTRSSTRRAPVARAG